MTPVAATTRARSSVMPPDASVFEMPRHILTQRRMSAKRPRVSGQPGSSLPTSSQVRCASSGCGTSAFLRHAANAASAGAALGVGAAVYLTEYAQNNKLVAAIEYAAETLSGIPSIIYGLVGMLFFCEFLGMQTSLLAGALTLVIMNLPTVLRTTQESLRTVPQSYREGAFGLGAGKWRVVRTVVLPGCIDGIVTGCILSAGRILGESAALLFTAGFAHTLNKFIVGLASPGATLTVALYAYAKEEGEFDVAFAIAAILMILTLLINLAARIVGRQIQKRSQA